MSINNRGDTIIEVLISIAVLSVILVGAYVSVNRSNTIIRDSQERLKALTIAQTQVESLVSWYKTNTTGSSCPESTLGISCADSSKTSFCLNTTTIAAQTSSDCYVASNNTLAGPQPMLPSASAQPPYYYNVNIYASSVNLPNALNHQTSGICVVTDYNYEIQVNWTSLLSGIKTDNVTLYYRPSILPLCTG